ncbi:fibrohexamerin-like [Ostrinia nubilalis]|uniref:fibrohexamerin-like n=1 Tax=Ostrinia furnacalis TaxID=93504 RepID=UPI00103CE353|nr:fibrohexamerin-like [Ostrinia furnacalis]
MASRLIVLSVILAAAWAASPPVPQPKSGKVRPCYLNDYKCIADNLAANSKCNKKVVGSVPSQYTVRNQRFETPYFNSSYVDNVLIVRNHNKCYVSEFFFNIDRDTLVLSVDCPKLDLDSNRTLIQHHSLGEDTEYNYHIRGNYPLIRMTTNLKHADKLDLCSAYVLGDVTALPIFNIDPLDKPTANFLSHDLTFLNIYERETFFYRARHLLRYFVNSYICNFGCN